MKRLSLFAVVLLALSFSGAALAQRWFPVHANIYRSQTSIQAQVINTYNFPIMCRGQVMGITFRGMPLYAFFNNVILLPRQNAFAFVHTNYMNPFVNYSASIQCIAY